MKLFNYKLITYDLKNLTDKFKGNVYPSIFEHIARIVSVEIEIKQTAQKEGK